MLPGGLDIIGIFAMAPPAIMTTVQNKLKLVGKLHFTPNHVDFTCANGILIYYNK